MTMTELPKLADQIPGFEKLIQSLELTGATVEIEGLTGTARGYVLSRVFQRLKKTLHIFIVSFFGLSGENHENLI